MKYHKLLDKQIKKHLDASCLNNEKFKKFINVVNESYLAFERDKDIMDHVFNINELEFKAINSDLKKEYELKQKSIATIYESINALDTELPHNQLKKDEDELIFISNYLKTQIAKRKSIENDLLTTVALLKNLLANLQSGILVEDENRNILFSNDLFCSMFKIPATPEQIIGSNCKDSLDATKILFKEPDMFITRIDEILAHKTILLKEQIETAEGKILERDYIPIIIENKYKGHLWKYKDVTNVISAQKKLEQSEQRNLLIMNASLNAIITINMAGNITFWNDKAEKIFGWKKHEVLGKKLSNIIIPHQHREAHERGMQHYLKTSEGPVLNKTIELTALNINGEEFPIEISIAPLQQGNDQFFSAFIQDISERKKAETNLKFQEEKYRNIIANMNLGLIEVDNNDKIIYANQGFENISGYTIQEIIGKNPEKFLLCGNNKNIIQEKKKLRSQGFSDIYQLPIKNKRGELKWWAISGAPNYDDKGNLLGSIGIHLDITEQKKLELALEEEKVKAEYASKAKEAFLANMSHEIRTPLNAIIGFLRELSKQQLTQIQAKFIENSSIAAKHLLAIINNVLDISKIESGEMSLEHEDFNLENCIKNVITVLEPKASEKNLKLQYQYDSKLHKIFKGDSLRLEQILFNLIGNSIKFTSKGFININCKYIKDQNNTQEFCIEVKDTGIGMNKNYIQTIFKKFSQEDKSISRKFGGTGLGMTITHELVQLMKGTISVESKRNEGTTFTIRLTFIKGDPLTESQNTLELKKSEKKIEGKILLVEDNEMNRMVAQNTLQYHNCKLVEATNGLEAIEILKKQNFDIILMDIQMPEMDGIEATKIIRKDLKLNTPIIALTANAFKSEIDKCKKVGMNDYITKPYDENVFIEIISNHLHIQNSINNNTDKIYNLNSLKNLSRGNNEFVIKMLTIFVEQTLETLKKIDDAFIEQNSIEIGRLIHKIKPSIEGVGIFSIVNEVKEFEMNVKESAINHQLLEDYTIIKNTLLQAIEQIKNEELK